MPWEPSDATRHTKKADTEQLRQQWASVANGVLRDSGDEGRAIRIANAHVAQKHRARKKGK